MIELCKTLKLVARISKLFTVLRHHA